MRSEVCGRLLDVLGRVAHYASAPPDLRDQRVADAVDLRLPDDHVVAAAGDELESRRLLEPEAAVGLHRHDEERDVAAFHLITERRGLHAVEMPDAPAAELQPLARQIRQADVEVQPLAEPLL